MRNRGLNYREEEDVALCQAWAAVSAAAVTDARARAEQRTRDGFLLQVQASFEQTLQQRNVVVCVRPIGSLAGRFQTISQAVARFAACHAAVMDEDSASGHRASAELLKRLALQRYEAEIGRFRFIKCWQVLRWSEQWRDQIKATARHDTGCVASRPKKRRLMPVYRTNVSANENAVAKSGTDEASASLLLPDDAEETEALADEEEEDTREKADYEAAVPAFHLVGRPKSPRQLAAARSKPKEDENSATSDVLERAVITLTTLYTRAMKQSAADTKSRLRLEQEEADLRLFATPLPSQEEDPMAYEYLTLRREQVLRRLKAGMNAERAGESGSSDGMMEVAAMRGRRDFVRGCDFRGLQEGQRTTI